MASTLDKANTFMTAAFAKHELYVEFNTPEMMHAYALSLTPEIQAETRREIADELEAILDTSGNMRVANLESYIEKLRGEK